MGYPLPMSSDLPYRSRAVRAMVLLHEEHLRRFVQTWRLAMAVAASLPPTADPSYASLGALERHVLSAAVGYLVWICEVLRLPDPEVRRIDSMLEHAVMHPIRHSFQLDE